MFILTSINYFSNVYPYVCKQLILQKRLSLRLKKYCRNVYPYELYIQGKNYQEIIKCLKVRGKKSGSLVKADPDLSSKKVKTDRVSEEHSSRDCLDTRKLIIHTVFMY